VDTKSLEYLLTVSAGGVGLDLKLCRDLPVCPSLGHQLRHLTLSRAQTEPLSGPLGNPEARWNVEVDQGHGTTPDARE